MENGDKCAWVGYTLGVTSPSTVPGGLNNITGNDGKKYAVQSLWSNNSAEGAGLLRGRRGRSLRYGLDPFRQSRSVSATTGPIAGSIPGLNSRGRPSGKRGSPSSGMGSQGAA